MKRQHPNLSEEQQGKTDEQASVPENFPSDEICKFVWLWKWILANWISLQDLIQWPTTVIRLEIENETEIKTEGKIDHS